MEETSRRDFLKRSGAGLAASLLPVSGWAAADDPIPPHRPVALDGLHAYADDESVDAGGTLRLFVSSTVPYRLSVCRLGLKVDDPAGDLVLHAFPESPALAQPIHPGSYVHVENRAEEAYGAISLECWLRPWKLTAAQAVLTEVDVPQRCSYGLFVTAAGEAAFYLGDGAFRADGLHAGPRLDVRRWHHLVGTWDGRRRRSGSTGRRPASAR